MTFRSHFGFLFDFCDLHVSRWASRRQSDWNRLGALDLIPRYFDRQGFPIPGDGPMDAVLAWAKVREETDCIVAWDELPDGSHLSTVWLGMDHNFFFGPPHIFETMRFTRDTHPVQLPGGTEFQGRESLEFPDPFGEPGETADQLRYTTEEEALAAHHEIVRRIRLREGH